MAAYNSKAEIRQGISRYCPENQRPMGDRCRSQQLIIVPIFVSGEESGQLKMPGIKHNTHSFSNREYPQIGQPFIHSGKHIQHHPQQQQRDGLHDPDKELSRIVFHPHNVYCWRFYCLKILIRRVI